MLNLDIDSYSKQPKSSLEPIMIAIAIVIDFLFVLSFLTVEIQSRRFHYFEWKNNKLQFRFYFIILAFFRAVWWFWYFVDDQNIKTQFQSFMDITELLITQLYFRGFLYTLVILILKDTNDLLQGISKLDNRVMISRF